MPHTVLFRNEIFGPYPHLVVSGEVRSSYWGPIPYCSSLALQGVGEFREWRADIPDCLVALALRYDQLYRFGVMQVCGLLSNGDETAVRNFVRVCAKYPPFPLWLIRLRTVHLMRRDQLLGHPVTLLRNTCPIPPSVLHRFAWEAVYWPEVEQLATIWPRLSRSIQMALRCCRTVTTDTIRCLGALPPPCVTPGLVKACESSQLHEVYESCQMAFQLARGDWRWGAVSDYETLLNLPHRLSAHLNDFAFREPPLPDAFGIQAIRNIHALLEEAYEMGHCILTRRTAIMCGSLYSFRVDYPERATCVLRWLGGKWHLGELAGIKNQPLREETHHHVRQWLVEHGGIVDIDIQGDTF